MSLKKRDNETNEQGLKYEIDDISLSEDTAFKVIAVKSTNKNDKQDTYWSTISIRKIMPMRRFIKEIANENNITTYLQSIGAFYNQDDVILCGNSTGSQMYFDSNDMRWKCDGRVNPVTREVCCNGQSKSYKCGSFFENRDISDENTLSILYLWTLKIRIATIATMVGVDYKTVKSVLEDWYQMIREDIEGDDYIIRGEIDESKLGKRKYHQIVRYIENTPGKKYFTVTVKNQTRRALNGNIEPESIYSSLNLRDNDVQTNAMEGTVNGVEVNVSPRLLNIETMPQLLLEFIWRKKHHGDIWGGVIQCLSEISFSGKSHKYTTF